MNVDRSKAEAREAENDMFSKVDNYLVVLGEMWFLWFLDSDELLFFAVVDALVTNFCSRIYAFLRVFIFQEYKIEIFASKNVMLKE